MLDLAPKLLRAEVAQHLPRGSACNASLEHNWSCIWTKMLPLQMVENWNFNSVENADMSKNLFQFGTKS